MALEIGSFKNIESGGELSSDSWGNDFNATVLSR